MNTKDTSTLPKSAWLAIMAVLVLAGVLTWRLLDTTAVSGSGGEGDAVTAAPQTLDQMQSAAEEAGSDSEAWQRLGLAYFNANRFPEAAAAYKEATSVEPESAILWSAMGEALVMASETDPIPPEALEAFRKAAELDSTNPRARYFLAAQKDLSGNHEGAIGDWLALLADTPAGAPWETDLVRTITQVGQIQEIPVQERIEQALGTRNILPAPATQGIPGPSQEQMAAAAALSPNEQQDMAEAMVQRLATRLDSDPENVEGWIMLMRSYQTLGRYGEAREAYRNAVSSNPQSEAQLQAAAEALGL